MERNVISGTVWAGVQVSCRECDGHFPAGGEVLDLMSSWVSHLPPEVAYRRVVGLGVEVGDTEIVEREQERLAASGFAALEERELLDASSSSSSESLEDELLRLSSWDGLSNAEIAAVMGLKQNAIDQRLFRARSRLRERFDDLSQEPLGIKARNPST